MLMYRIIEIIERGRIKELFGDEIADAIRYNLNLLNEIGENFLLIMRIEK